jgi:ElaB/YqjD/DUF883 family membrane-anchored ribosome-binding protein
MMRVLHDRLLFACDPRSPCANAIAGRGLQGAIQRLAARVHTASRVTGRRARQPVRLSNTRDAAGGLTTWRAPCWTDVMEEATMAAPTTTGDRTEVGPIEREIAQARHDVGRTVQEIGSRLTPAHLMEQAKRGLRDTTIETTRAVAQSASDVASGVTSRTRDVAQDARDRVQAHPFAAGAIGAAVGLSYWLVSRSMRERRRLVPREWDEPFDRSSRRRSTAGLGAVRAMPVAAAAAAAFLLWRARVQ